jgi:putative lipoprotein
MSRAMAVTLVLSVLALPARAADDDAWSGPDKALHFSVSVGLTTGSYAAVAFFTDHLGLRAALAAGVALAAGAAKELADLAGLGHPSWKDFTWDVIGTFTGVVTALLLDRLVLAPLGAQLPVW